MCSSADDNMAESSRDERKSSRRSNKPLMEKRRRARINECLTELKGLVLQAMKKDSTQYSKLEKADILEMTVKHLKLLQRQHVAATLSTDPFIMNKYRAGFNECAGEVARYMESIAGVDRAIKNRVLNHLANCVSHVVTPISQSSSHVVHPALVQPLHVQMPPANQLGVSAFSITCTPTWNVIGSSNVPVSVNGVQQIAPPAPAAPPAPSAPSAYSSKMEYTSANRVSSIEPRPPKLQCIVSPMDTSRDVKRDSSLGDDVDNCCSLDLSIKGHCDNERTTRTPDSADVVVAVKQEEKAPCVAEPEPHQPRQQPAPSNDAMWRPW